MRVIDADFLFDVLHDRMKGAEEWITRAETDELKARAEGFLSALIEIKLSIEDEVTTIEAEPVKHAKWVKVYGDHLSMGHRPWTLACSECDRLGDGTPFCPNCGAKMEGGTENEID